MKYLVIKKIGVPKDWNVISFKNRTDLKKHLKSEYDISSISSPCLNEIIKTRCFYTNSIECVIEEVKIDTSLSITKIQGLICDDIQVKAFYSNNPGCENYINTVFFDGDFKIETMVPYYYRRSGPFLETEQEIADYLLSIKSYFKREAIDSWCKQKEDDIADDKSMSASFLKKLLEIRCQEITQDYFSQNNNPQKLFQSLKDKGYVISILRGNKANNNKTRYWLLPVPLCVGTIYETMSDEFKKHVIKILGRIDAYENKKVIGLLPDHKFSEIRWDETVPEENSISMPEDKVKEKFQLLTTQRNLQKREVCRHCYTTGERGAIFGIKYFFEGTDNWDSRIPQKGKEAEKGCIGCPWYDIQKWREKFQVFIDDKAKKGK